jgi:hypothetical protein
MGLKDVLRTLRLVELDDVPRAPRPAASAPSAGRAERLDEILAAVEPPREIDERTVRGAEQTSGGLPFPGFPEVYAAAGITEPGHGFSAFKVLEILQAPEVTALEPKQKATALLAFLKMNPGGAVAIADVVQDAVRRDQALDKFEEFLRVKLAERAAAQQDENAKLQAEIDALTERNRARMDASRQALDEERRRFDAWIEAKRGEERRLAAAVEPFVESSPISS